MKHLIFLIALFFAVNLTAQIHQSDTIIYTINMCNNEKIVFWGAKNMSGKHLNKLKTKNIFLYKGRNKRQLVWNADQYLEVAYSGKNYQKHQNYCIIDINNFILKDNNCSLILNDFRGIWIVSLRNNGSKWNTIFYKNLNIDLESGFPSYFKQIGLNYWLKDGKIYHFVQVTDRDKKHLIIYEAAKMTTFPQLNNKN